VFYGTTLNAITLNVYSPGIVSDYQAASIWKDFSTISLSTKTHLLDKNLRVYPNPSKIFITISGLSTSENYSIYTILGAKVNTGRVSNKEKIDVQNLTNGVYFIKLGVGNTIKFIKK